VHSFIPNEISLTITVYYKNIKFRKNTSIDFAQNTRTFG